MLNDVTRRRVIKFAYDEPLARPGRWAHFYDAPGCTEAASYHAEVDVPDELRARTTEMIDDVTGAVLATGPRDADRPAIHYVADAGARVQPGLSVSYGTERGRFLVPAALVAWVISLGLALPFLFADLARAGDLRRPGDRGAAVVLGAVLRAGAAQRRAPAGAARARALPAVPGRGDRRRRGGGWLARVPRLGGTLEITWGIGALVAVLAAGILTVEAARAPAAAKRPINGFLPRLFRREPDSRKGIRDRSAVVARR